MPLPPSAPTGVVLQTPPRIKVARHVRNGLIPNAVFETELASSVNFVAGCRTKELFRGFGNITAIPTSADVTRTRWRFAAHTGPLLRKHRVVFYAALQNDGNAAFNPKITLTITNASESVTYGSCDFYFGAAQGSSTEDVPSEFGYGEIELFGVPASTTVYGKFVETSMARLISATVFEESKELVDVNGYVFPQNVSVGAPILDERRQNVYELARDLWTDGAAHLVNWTVDNQASPQTNASATFKNVIDLSTSYGSGPRWLLDTRYCGTRARSTLVPCVFAVYAKMSGSTDFGEVGLGGVNGGDGIATVTPHGSTAQWYTTTCSLPADLDENYVYFANPDFGSGGETISVYAVSIFQLA